MKSKERIEMFNLKTDWCLMKTNKGYTFTLYEPDNITISREVRAKTAKNMAEKIKALESLAGMFKGTKRLKKVLNNPKRTNHGT